MKYEIWNSENKANMIPQVLGTRSNMDIYKSGQLKILLGCFPSAEGVRIKKFFVLFLF